jgi:hypothetical protein
MKHLAQTGGCYRLKADGGHDGGGKLPKVLLNELQRNLCGKRRQSVLQL